MEIEYYYKNKKFKDEGVQIRVTTDSGVVKAVCPKNPLAVWAITYGKHLTPVFHLDMEPFLVEYSGDVRKPRNIGQLLYDLSKRRIVKQYTCLSSAGNAKTRIFSNWISTSSLDSKGKVRII